LLHITNIDSGTLLHTVPLAARSSPVALSSPSRVAIAFEKKNNIQLQQCISHGIANHTTDRSTLATS